MLVVWLLLLVPAFLLAFVRGWRGISTALAIGLFLIAAVHAALAVFG
jgi:hypothetical protein